MSPFIVNSSGRLKYLMSYHIVVQWLTVLVV